ncbi:MAG: tetratricopeptide repeat protein [Mariprofundales bacterium]|nr:tetratricopeptide repeat protein [Mariprofundales bacterium]
MTSEFDDLKQEMRSAQITAWVLDNKQVIGGIVAVLIIALLASSLWIERNRAQRDSAAVIYHQGLAMGDLTKRKALLETIVRDYSRTGYAPLALFQLVSLDEAKAESYLQQLLASSAPPELKWQARLDLAQRLIERGDLAGAQPLLKERVGREYEQLRYYLLAESATDSSVKRQALQQAASAPSHDERLKTSIETAIAAL